jgi:hypothetical protein
MVHTQIEDEPGRSSNEERTDMAVKLRVEVVRPTEGITTVQQEVRTKPVVEEFIDPREMSGEHYDLPWGD